MVGGSSPSQSWARLSSRRPRRSSPSCRPDQDRTSDVPHVRAGSIRVDFVGRRCRGRRRSKENVPAYGSFRIQSRLPLVCRQGPLPAGFFDGRARTADPDAWPLRCDHESIRIPAASTRAARLTLVPGPSATSHRPRVIRVHGVGQTANVDDDRHGATIAALYI